MIILAEQLERDIMQWVQDEIGYGDEPEYVVNYDLEDDERIREAWRKVIRRYNGQEYEFAVDVTGLFRYLLTYADISIRNSLDPMDFSHDIMRELRPDFYQEVRYWEVQLTSENPKNIKVVDYLIGRDPIEEIQQYDNEHALVEVSRHYLVDAYKKIGKELESLDEKREELTHKKGKIDAIAMLEPEEKNINKN